MDICNYFKYSENLSAGGQPTTEQLKELKKKGVKTIVNLSPASTKNYLPKEAVLVEELEMDYVHFPVDCSNLKPSHYTMFSNILKECKDVETFVHCGGNIKTSNFIFMYKVLEERMNKNEAMAELELIQHPEEKWLKYFEAMGI